MASTSPALDRLVAILFAVCLIAEIGIDLNLLFLLKRRHHEHESNRNIQAFAISTYRLLTLVHCG
jgi:hypothetical protein